MPVPAFIAGFSLLTWLGGLVSSVVAMFGSLMAFLASYMGVRLAIRIGVGVIFFSIFAGIMSAVETLMVGIAYVTPFWFQTFQSWVIPSNFDECVSVIISTKATIWFWHWKKYYIELLAHGN